jgi:lipoprotein YgeR
MKVLALTFAILFSLSAASFSEQQVHTLKKNETLYRLSKQYNVTVEAILKANSIDDPTSLRVGENIIIPHSYFVRPGDTLYGIARKHNTTVENLLELNNLDKGYVLKVEDSIMLPQEEGPVRTAAAATTEGPEPDDSVQDNLSEAPTGTTRTDNERAVDRELDLQRELFWPINGKIQPYEGKMSGTQIEGERGDPVVSISSGEVVWVGPYRGFGNVILIQSPDRFIYVYGGNEKTNVAVGETVNPGMEIGTLGIHPHGEKPVLFFTVFKDGKPVDPEKAPRI